jgi:hypothetical protein
MAELSDRKQQNQAFLQELERQRLNKDCLRIIDLRGKVAGECQAYQFGNRTHYLDDRAYLLARQLMARFDGRYTVGVYEALFQALKQLEQSQQAEQDDKQLLPVTALDQPLQRAEERIVFSTALQLRLGDVLYHGYSIDLSVNAIRVSLKRTFSLQREDIVTVSFADLYQQYALPLLQDVRYQITKLEQDDIYTTVVLRRESRDDAFAQWFTEWLSHHSSQRQIDVDNELINLQSQFYQRLWLGCLGDPVLWLGATSLSQPLQALTLSPSAPGLLQQHQGSLAQWLQCLPLQLSEKGADLLVAFDDDQSYSVTLDNHHAVVKLIQWQLNRPHAQLLLLRPTLLNLDNEAIRAACQQIKPLEPDYAATLSQRARRISQRLRIIDLKPLFRHSRKVGENSDKALAGLQTLKSFINADLPAPSPLTSFIQRGNTRFHIHTPVTVHASDQQWQLDTVDVSADGLAIKMPADVPITLNQRLQIDFNRWQTLTKKVNLSAVPYQVKNIHFWEGELQIGLARIKNNCPESLNQFFDWVIKQNQDKLRADTNDVISTAESQLFGQALLPTLDSVPLFIGLNPQGQRQLQLIGATRDNFAAQHPGLWQALASAQAKLAAVLKQANDNDNGCYDSFLYAYDNKGWTLALEQDFADPRDKAIWIQRGMAADCFRVFRCRITVLKAADSESETDLLEQLQQWRQQRAHRVRDIRQQLNQLLAMVELSDISDVVTAFYAQ